MFMTPPFYLFLIGSAAATIVLRRKRTGDDHGFRMPGFPLPPLVVGLAGLAAAVELARAGWAVTVYDTGAGRVRTDAMDDSEAEIGVRGPGLRSCLA